MKKNIITKIVGLVLGISLLLGAAGFYAINSVSAGTAAQVTTNNLSRGTWKISVTDVKFKIGTNATQKFAEVYTTIESTSGRNTAMLPMGSITGLVGSSGKTYSIVVIDSTNHIDRSLDVMFKNSETDRKKFATKNGKVFEQGVYLLAPGVMVDKAETSITALIYQDENGNISNIPVNVTAVTEQVPMDGK